MKREVKIRKLKHISFYFVLVMMRWFNDKPDLQSKDADKHSKGKLFYS
jgi:hypothetical protein